MKVTQTNHKSSHHIDACGIEGVLMLLAGVIWRTDATNSEPPDWRKKHVYANDGSPEAFQAAGAEQPPTALSPFGEATT